MIYVSVSRASFMEISQHSTIYPGFRVFDNCCPDRFLEELNRSRPADNSVGESLCSEGIQTSEEQRRADFLFSPMSSNSERPKKIRTDDTIARETTKRLGLGGEEAADWLTGEGNLALTRPAPRKLLCDPLRHCRSLSSNSTPDLDACLLETLQNRSTGRQVIELHEKVWHQ